MAIAPNNSTNYVRVNAGWDRAYSAAPCAGR